MNQQSYLTKWKTNLEKQYSFINWEKVKQPLPFARSVSFSPSEEGSDDDFEQKDDKEDTEDEINTQLEILNRISNRRTYITDQNDDGNNEKFQYEQEGTVEDYDDEYQQLNRPWYTRLKDIVARPRERTTIGEEKVLSPTPTPMTAKDQPIVLYIKFPLFLPIYPRLLQRPEFYFE